MKKLIIIFMVAALVAVLAVPAAAIDKSKKIDKSKADTTAVEQAVPDSSARQTQDDSAKKNYDDFIDRNNNGIDDRAEKNTVPAKPVKKQTSPEPPPKKTNP